MPTSGIESPLPTAFDRYAGTYTIQQIVAQVQFHRDLVGGAVVPLQTSDCQQAVAIAYNNVMAADFGSPPVPWFKNNQNSIPFFTKPWDPPPLIETVRGVDFDDGKGFNWLPTNNSSAVEGDVYGSYFDANHDAWIGLPPGGPLLAIGPSSLAYCASQYIGGDTATRGTAVMVRTRIVSPPHGSTPFNVTTYRVDHTGRTRISSGRVPGVVFNPQGTVPDITTDPLPITFAYYLDTQIWCPNPNSIPFNDP